MRRTLLALLLLLLPALAAHSDGLGATDAAAMQTVISRQIDAFRAGDGEAAYGYASPTIRQIFPTPEVFMAMVRSGYPMVYRPQKFTFGRTEASTAGPVQHVIFIGPDGKTYEAVYAMQRQPDGSWKINGCALVKLPGLDA